MRNIAILLLFFATFSTACSNGNSKAASKSGKNTTKNAKIDDNNIGFEVFTALQENDLKRFKKVFLQEGIYDDFAKMLTSVELTPEQKATTLDMASKTLKSWSNNDDFHINKLFNSVRQQGYDKGIDWKSTSDAKYKTTVKQVTEYAMYLNVYEVVIDFKDQNKVAHQLVLPVCYKLDNGVYTGSLKLNY